jgi:hypothetical protein
MCCLGGGCGGGGLSSHNHRAAIGHNVNHWRSRRYWGNTQRMNHWRQAEKECAQDQGEKPALDGVTSHINENTCPSYAIAERTCVFLARF